MGPPSKKGTDKDDDVSNAGRGWGEKFEETFEDLDGLYGKGGKDDVKNSGGKVRKRMQRRMLEEKEMILEAMVGQEALMGWAIQVGMWNLVAM